MTKMNNRDAYSKDGSSKRLQRIKMRSLTTTGDIYSIWSEGNQERQLPFLQSIAEQKEGTYLFKLHSGVEVWNLCKSQDSLQSTRVSFSWPDEDPKGKHPQLNQWKHHLIYNQGRETGSLKCILHLIRRTMPQNAYFLAPVSTGSLVSVL